MIAQNKRKTTIMNSSEVFCRFPLIKRLPKDSICNHWWSRNKDHLDPVFVKMPRISSSLLPKGETHISILPRRGLMYIPSYFSLTNVFLVRLQQAFVLCWNPEYDWKIEWTTTPSKDTSLILRPMLIQHPQLFVSLEQKSCFIEFKKKIRRTVTMTVTIRIGEGDSFLSQQQDEEISSHLEPLLFSLHECFYQKTLYQTMDCMPFDLIQLILLYL
jgi:hypothetical protein